MTTVHDDGTLTLINGDCIEVMAAMPAESVDAIVTDPPYGLEFMGKEWDAPGRMPGAMGLMFDRVPGAVKSEGYRQMVGKMPQFQAWCETWAREALRVLKPGGHLLAFGGTRTYHRLTCAIEDAGFEIRDCLVWLYGSGFPKSLDVSKAIDKAAGAEREVVGARKRPGGPSGMTAARGWNDGPMAHDDATVDVTAPATPEAQAWAGWGTALKPSHEPIVVARKPLAGTVAGNVLAHGVGGLNIDACRIAGDMTGANFGGRQESSIGYGGTDADGTYRTEQHAAGRWPANVALSHTDACRQTGTRRIKPIGATAHQQHHGKGRMLNPGEGKASHPGYRDADGLETVAAWECSPECPVRMLDEQAGERDAHGASFGVQYPGRHGGNGGDAPPLGGVDRGLRGINDVGGPSRFFYTSKASTAERDGASHPTVKPLDLMRWLVRLVTPPGGLILEPFAGSGTTLIAARAEGFRCIGIERDESYAAMAVERIRRRYDPAAAAWADDGDDGQLNLLGGG